MFSSLEFKENLDRFLSSPLLGNRRDFLSNGCPYTRPCRPQDLQAELFTKALTEQELDRNSYLAAQRMLNVIYEKDLVLLPTGKQKKLDINAYQSFYSSDHYRSGEVIREDLERHCFDFLNHEIQISGKWDIESFTAYCQQELDDIAQSESSLLKNLTASADPESATRFFLIQCAGDFLSEASAMGRNVLGNFGSHTSELFKVFIDEYGYGVHEKKHSTIFEHMMTDAELDNRLHTYWQFYTASSLSLINYFHYISKNHQYFFRYLGALYFTEASLAFTTKSQSKLVKQVFGGRVKTKYFDEHTHIDVHHGRMALEKIIMPVVKEYGEGILPEILRGFQEFAHLQELADEDLYRHIRTHDTLAELQEMASRYQAQEGAEVAEFVESEGELSVTHCHDVNEHFSVVSGEIDLVFSPHKRVKLKAGQAIVIPKGILHGSCVVSKQCTYRVTEYRGELCAS
ncbi:iron-containing redox enzyme family protein [Reinekea blandensis]|nr:iron-containing redox enzyme family protein [Reinekea blandensis]